MNDIERKQLLLEQRVALLEQYQLEMCKLLMRNNLPFMSFAKSRFRLLRLLKPLHIKLTKYRRYNKLRQWIHRI